MTETPKPKLLNDMELVHRQLHCVKHLCQVVEELADAKIKMLPGMAIDTQFGHHLIKMDGEWTHSFMEWVGDMLNGMDAVQEEDVEKWKRTFKDAQDRWSNLLDELNDKLIK